LGTLPFCFSKKNVLQGGRALPFFEKNTWGGGGEQGGGKTEPAKRRWGKKKRPDMRKKGGRSKVWGRGGPGGPPKKHRANLCGRDYLGKKNRKGGPFKIGRKRVPHDERWGARGDFLGGPPEKRRWPGGVGGFGDQAPRGVGAGNTRIKKGRAESQRVGGAKKPPFEPEPPPLKGEFFCPPRGPRRAKRGAKEATHKNARGGI